MKIASCGKKKLVVWKEEMRGKMKRIGGGGGPVGPDSDHGVSKNVPSSCEVKIAW